MQDWTNNYSNILLPVIATWGVDVCSKEHLKIFTLVMVFSRGHPHIDNSQSNNTLMGYVTKAVSRKVAATE